MASVSLQRKLSGYIEEMRKIRSLSDPSSRTDPLKMSQSMADFLDKIDIEEIRSLLESVPVRFHRHLILASIRGALRKLRKASRSAARSPELAAKEIGYALLWMEQASKAADTIQLFRQAISSDAQPRFFLSPESLSKNDIILSYKTTYYLKRSILSRMVALATNSPITHAMLVCHGKDGAPKLLVSGDKTKGLGLVDPVTAPGEMFIVMRPADGRDGSGQLSKAVDLWHARASYRQETPLKNERSRWKFAEVKCQFASLVGFCYVLSVKFLARPFIVTNPIKNDSQVFCTELIDNIFKKAGILLSPRSEHDALVGPIELLYSPALSFVGVIASPEDLSHAEEEIRSQFFTNSGSLSRSLSGFLRNRGSRSRS